jgi:putative flippase GtrA
MIASLVNNRFLRFLVVGAVNTLFSYAVYAAMLFVGLSYVYANFIALITGILFSFRTQGTYVFRSREKNLFGRFVLCWAVIYVANIFFIKLMMQIGFDAYVAGALALPPIVLLSYYAQKLLVFRVSKSA